ncbi:hypothetical protein QTP70_017904 [Hemibagrus guttatus]|uniref:Reverse transcriptase domain-containing protein n=1 Tax=Hemibagrus guttatus TaxID=175788 RepID=A0AAE0QZQ2_9TELE|nr:hypothetical protein QTP70_017904 [Hemibagrus guttatus]
MLKTLTKKLRRHSLNEIHPFQLKNFQIGAKTCHVMSSQWSFSLLGFIRFGLPGPPPMTATQNTLHRNLMLLPAGGGPTGRWAYIVSSGCARPSPAGKDSATRISRRSQGLEGVRFGDHRISSLIFADDVVLLASSGLDLQHALGRFAAECEAAGMRVSTSKSEAMVLDWKKVACTLQVGGEVLPQVEEFKYLGVLFTSEGRMDREIDRRIGAAAAVMRSMYRFVVVKKELSRKAKLSIYQSIYAPTLTYGHELWVMTERISYHGSEEGGESEDSEGENQELAQIDRASILNGLVLTNSKPFTFQNKRRRNCVLTPLATSQQPNQGLLSPGRVRRVRLLLEPSMERHSSEEELERIAGIANSTGAEAGCRWHRHGELSSASSDEEVKDLCEAGASPTPVLFSSSPPRGLKPTHTSTRLHNRPIILSHFEQPTVPYWRHRREPGRPSLDLEKMQQKMLLKKNCGGKTRTIKIRNLTGSRHPPRYSYDPSIFAFRSLSTAPPCSPLLSSEEPPCA